MLKNIMIKKINGNSEIIKKETNLNKVEMQEELDLFENILDCKKIKNVDYAVLENLKSVLSKTITYLKRNNFNEIERIFNALKKADNKEDLNLICDSFTNSILMYSTNDSNFKIKNIKNILLSSEISKDVIIYLLTTRILNAYFDEKIDKLNDEELNKIHNLKYIYNDGDILYEFISKDSSGLNKNNMYEIFISCLNSCIDKCYLNRFNHKCFECENSVFDTCPKVFEAKKPINKYNFITDGYQIINENGEILDFVVSKCNRDKKAKELKKTL